MRPTTENTDEQYTDPRSPVEQAALDGLAEALARYAGPVKRLPSCTYGAKLRAVKDPKDKTRQTLVTESDKEHEFIGWRKMSQFASRDKRTGDVKK